MRITVEIAESDLREICQITGERRKALAIRKFVRDALQMKRRERFVQEVLSGKLAVEFQGYEEARAADRRASERARRRD
jgi:hypothetical protein